jgi:hypothetical protein
MKQIIPTAVNDEMEFWCTTCISPPLSGYNPCSTLKWLSTSSPGKTPQCKLTRANYKEGKKQKSIYDSASSPWMRNPFRRYLQTYLLKYPKFTFVSQLIGVIATLEKKVLLVTSKGLCISFPNGTGHRLRKREDWTLWRNFLSLLLNHIITKYMIVI